MIIVSNPGTHPEMMRIAGGLIEAGQPVKYLTSSSWAGDSGVQRLSDLRPLSSLAIAVNMRRRRLPSPIRRSHVVGLARTKEALFQIAFRTPFGDARTALQTRNDTFQRKVTRVLRRTPDVRAVVAQYTSAEEVFRGAPTGVLKVLNYPIAHHRWLMDAMMDEALVNPEWKSLLQGHDFSEHELVSLDKEIQMADAVLVPSSFAASTFVAKGVPPEKLVVIPLGCEPAPAGSGAECEGDAEGEDLLRVIFAGQATQRKGLGYLVEAVGTLDDVQLTVVGPASSECRTILASYSNVTLMRSQPRDRLYDLMRQADLLVLPSLAEGFGLVALEAMANGTPCLMSRRTFAEDIIVHGENGYILNEVSSKSIAEAISSIRRNKDKLASVSERAVASANYFSWDRYSAAVAKKLLNLLDVQPSS